jgi:hypothetical protein
VEKDGNYQLKKMTLQVDRLRMEKSQMEDKLVVGQKGSVDSQDKVWTRSQH